MGDEKFSGKLSKSQKGQVQDLPLRTIHSDGVILLS